MNREIESRPVEAQPARPPVLSAEHPGQRTAVGRYLDAHQSADLVTAPDEACRAAEKQWFPRGRIDGGREGPKNDVACEMVDGHGLDRTSLGVRSHVAVSAHENTSRPLSTPFNLHSRETSDPIAMLANVDPKQQFHGPSVSRKKRSVCVLRGVLERRDQHRQHTTVRFVRRRERLEVVFF